MKAIKKNTTLTIKTNTIQCPECLLKFVVYAVFDNGHLVSQVPDYGMPFYCPYCGINVNDGEGEVQ